MSKRILIVDDEPRYLRLLEANLRTEGYEVATAHDGVQAVDIFSSQPIDLILLDIMMPRMDGFSTCQRIREYSSVPIIMLTARLEETDRLIGLEMGADDYIVKPFSPREVVARTRAVLRRSEGEPVKPEVVAAGEVSLDMPRRQATVAGRPLDLTTMEFDLLAVMVSHPGQVFNRMQLLEQVQGSAYAGYERTIDAHIKNLRSKLGDDPHHPRFIETVRGVGYRFVQD